MNRIDREAMKPERGSSEPVNISSQRIVADPASEPNSGFLSGDSEIYQTRLQELNEALLQRHLETEELKVKYRDLYEFAPMGYFTLDSETRIREINVMGAVLLGGDRSLLNLPLTDFMDPSSRSEFGVYCLNLLETGAKQTCELRFVAATGRNFYGQLEGIAMSAMEAEGDRFRIALFDITERRQAEEHIFKQKELLVHGFMNTLEEERRTTAYELHDGLAQYIMAAQAFMDTYAERYRAAQGSVPEDLERGLEYLSQAVLEARRVVNNLRPLALDDLGLTGALEQALNEEKQRAGWQQADLHHNIFSRRFEAVLETAVYRVAQEALSNARLHAETDRVQVFLGIEFETEAELAHLTLQVRDWGKGFEVQAKRKEYDHVGLHSMAEHVKLLQGSFEIRSVPGEGTRIRAVFPISLKDALPPRSGVTLEQSF